ncbi:hypothetical protein G5V59_22940 [Nocardioides sp. W3-2-3]|uniref:hypothetical protein n=1 Tax=Nocardioides convexus TaxID=2712224 RepID=UPI0024186376|nr:hypothetical protein [Nocardioides convexus]NHA01640.1 hypothetical protein [Nocardioides convexus]
MIPELAGYTPAALANATPKGLALVEERISQVITAIDLQADLLDEVDFPTKGHIAKGSFGGGGRSATLALHHARAHGVVTTTLKDLRTDLVKFRTAIREAQKAPQGQGRAGTDRRADPAAGHREHRPGHPGPARGPDPARPRRRHRRARSGGHRRHRNRGAALMAGQHLAESHPVGRGHERGGRDDVRDGLEPGRERPALRVAGSHRRRAGAQGGLR